MLPHTAPGLLQSSPEFLSWAPIPKQLLVEPLPGPREEVNIFLG